MVLAVWNVCSTTVRLVPSFSEEWPSWATAVGLLSVLCDSQELGDREVLAYWAGPVESRPSRPRLPSLVLLS